MEDDLETVGAGLVIIQSPTRTDYVTREVNVHRAPTDESVRLLRDMEAQARDEVLKTVRVADTQFECVVHQWQDHMNDSMNWRAVFSLNGKKLTADADTSMWDLRNPDTRAQFAKLRDAMAKEIATHVLNDAFVDLLRHRFRTQEDQ